MVALSSRIDTVLAILVPAALNPGQEESLPPKSAPETGQSHRVLCFHPKGETQFMPRDSLIKSPNFAVPGIRENRTRWCAGTTYLKRGSAPEPPPLTVKWGKML